MSTRNLSGAERPARSSSVRSRICSISARSLTRWLSCQRQSFHCSSGTSSQIGARRLTAGAPVGAERLGRVGEVDERRLRGSSRGFLVRDRALDLLGVHAWLASGRRRPVTGADVRHRRIKSMQSACRRMIARWSGRRSSIGPRTDDDPGADRGREERGERRSAGGDYSPITDQSRPIMMKKPLNRAIRPMPP